MWREVKLNHRMQVINGYKIEVKKDTVVITDLNSFPVKKKILYKKRFKNKENLKKRINNITKTGF